MLVARHVLPALEKSLRYGNLRVVQAVRRCSFSSLTIGGSPYALLREDMTLLQVLRHHAFPVEFECLEGSCKKCSVEVEMEGERFSVLACQERALTGMRVLLPAGPDPTLARRQEQETKEKAQRLALARRNRKILGSADAQKPLKLVDRREKLPEVVAARELLASDQPPAELLDALRKLLAGLDGSRFWDVEQTCKLDDWLKKQKWGREKRRAENLRSFIADKLSDNEAEDVESMAC